ncbi:MAG: cytochrome c [Deltaproteobacteria bacterium]|nr:cytochrome c [Deltaproteobacteria bacterium]
MARRNHTRALAGLAAGLALLVLPGCRQDMHDQPKYQPLEESHFFDDGRASRPRVPGTVARGRRDDDALLVSGKADGKLAEVFPAPVTREMLERGRQAFDVYCSPCHDRVGTGQGMIVMRGYKQPTSFHDERLRGMPPGYFFDVATNGFGVMPSYAAQVPAADRWAIAAYVRALQLSQHATVAEVPAEGRAAFLEGKTLDPKTGLPAREAPAAHGDHAAPGGGHE